MNNPSMFARITKVDEAKRIVYGRLAQEVVDKSGEILDYAKSKPHFQKWSESFATATDGKSLGNVREMHGKIAAGKIVSIDFNDAEKAIDIGAKIVDDAAWVKVLEGVYTGYSVGGRYVGDKVTEKIDGADVKRYAAAPNEASLVDNPCIPTATFFSIAKADGTELRKDFKFVGDQVAKDKAAKVEAKARELAKAAGMDPDGKHKNADNTEQPIWKNYEKDAIKAIEPPKVEPVKFSVTLKGAAIGTWETTEIAADAVWKNDAGKEFVVKSVDADKKLVTVEEKVAKTEEAPYIEVVASNEDILAFGKLLNDNKLTMADALAVVKGHVDTKGKPAPVAVLKLLKDAANPKDKPVHKNLSTCASAMYLLQSLCSLQKDVQYEAFVEGDDSTLAGELRDAIKVLGEVVVRMCEEELKEEYLSEPQMLDVRGNVIALCDSAKGLAKAMGLTKAGARHGAADKKRVQNLHDTSVELGATCGASGEKLAVDTELLKTLFPDLKDEQLGKLVNALGGAVQAVPAQDLQKVVDAAVTKATAPLLEKIEKLEKMPMPPKAILAGGKPMQKADDKTVDHAAPAVEEIPVVKDAGGEDHPAAGVIKMLWKTGGAPAFAKRG